MAGTFKMLLHESKNKCQVFVLRSEMNYGNINDSV